MADDSAASIVIIGGTAVLAMLFLGYRWYQRKKDLQLQSAPKTPATTIINSSGKPVDVIPYETNNTNGSFGITFKDSQSETFNIQNNRTRAIALVYRYISWISWLPVDPIVTRSSLDELSRIKQSGNQCAAVIYDNMNILIFNRINLAVEEEEDIAVTIAKAYIKFRNFTPQPGIPLDSC